jgi:Arc/MetJ-type ribon-helix-helix transcriptional regulator
MPEQLVKEIDKCAEEGRFTSRSEAIRTIAALYWEREKTRSFYEVLKLREREAEKNPEILVPLEENP